MRDKAHFQIKLVKFARQTVGARVFIAETGGDLEIAVETGDHQQLLILLWCLRQCKEFACVDAAWHKKVARAFGAGCRQDGRRIFGEADIFHPAARFANDLCALDDIGVERFAAQIEKAVSQTRFFRIFLLTGNGQWQFFGLAQHGHAAGEDFNLPGRQMGIDRACAAGLHLAINGYDAFEAQCLQYRQSGAIGIGHDLRHAIMVA